MSWYVEEGAESGFIGTLKNLLSTEPTIQPEERTMEEFMYGQDMGNPEDGSL